MGSSQAAMGIEREGSRVVVAATGSLGLIGQDVLSELPPLNVWVADETETPAADHPGKDTPQCFACWGGMSSSPQKAASPSMHRQETPGVDSQKSRRRVSVKIKDQRQEQQSMRAEGSHKVDPQREKAREKARR